MDSEFLKERLAEADSQYTDLLEQLEPAREKWLNAEDPKTKDDLRAVYDDIMSMVDKTGTRIVQLEARIMNGWDAEVGNKRLRGEGMLPMRRGAPTSDTYGNVPMFGSPPPNWRGRPASLAPPSTKSPGSAPMRHMMVAD